MSTDTVTLGRMYKHDVSGKMMRAYAASCPDLEDYVRLIEPEGYGIWRGFWDRWDGTWAMFLREWTIQEPAQ